MNYKKITLDTERKSFESIVAMQGDNKSRYIEATIVNRSIPVDLTGCTVKFSAIKPDITDIFNDTVISDAKGGKAQIELTNQTLAVPGVIQATLVILKEDMQLSVLPFFITVIENPYNSNAIESKSEYKALNNALTIVEGYAKELQDASVNLEEKYTTRLNNFDSQLDNKRIFKPNLYGNLNWSVSKKVDNIFPYTDETLNSWKGCIDGIIIDIQIKPNSETINDNTTYYLNPTIEWINYVVNKCKELNIVIKGVKFHADEIRTNVNNLTFVNWFNKYKELIRSVTNVLKCDYLLYFNESSSLLNREVTEINIINEFTNELKSLGYEVGFAGTGVKNLDKGYIFDIISFHQYPAISGKLNNTTYSDSVIAWEQNRNTYLLNKAIKDYPNKKVMLGEAGCPDSWECLAVPEKWDWNSNDLTPNSQGLPSSIFLYGMLETYKNTNLDCACFWYCDPMLEETKKLLKKYI